MATGLIEITDSDFTSLVACAEMETPRDFSGTRNVVAPRIPGVMERCWPNFTGSTESLYLLCKSPVNRHYKIIIRDPIRKVVLEITTAPYVATLLNYQINSKTTSLLVCGEMEIHMGTTGTNIY